MIVHSENEQMVRKRMNSSISLVVIGCSTGGPAVLHTIIPLLRSDLRTPVLVVQHMPFGFVQPLADELDRLSDVHVSVAEHHGELIRGQVQFAPPDRHIGVRYRSARTLETVLSDEEPVHGCRPAVDPLAFSAARVLGRGAALIILTGMGTDGRDGAQRIRDAGGLVAAQDPDSSQVFGMPRAVIDDKLAHIILRPESVPDFISAAQQRKSNV